MSAPARPRALVYVQHLLGVGHLARTARVAAALVDRGVQVTMVRGGSPVQGFDVAGADLVQLDPVRAESGALGRLVGADGLPFGPERQAARRDSLLALLASLRPDILLIEAFPFGRRAMRFELLPLLELASNFGVRVIASSIRDILQERSRPDRLEETADLVERCFDLVLVHGDEATTPLAASFPLADRIADRTVYTGLVGPQPIVAPVTEHAVVVSAGGGAVGAALLLSAIEARSLSNLDDAPWLIVTGPNMDADAHAQIAGRAGPGLEVRRFVSNLPARLAGASLSISQAGYNTVAETMAARCRSVLVPFEQGGETEQLTRARHFAARGLAICLREVDLGPAALAQAVDRAMALDRPAAAALDGAARSADILLSHLAASCSPSLANSHLPVAVNEAPARH